MKILVLNSGSSSLKCQLFVNGKRTFKGHVDGIGLKTCKLSIGYNSTSEEKCVVSKDHSDAIKLILDELLKSKIILSHNEIDAIGHRVVHGEEKYNSSVLITDEVIKDIESFSEIAPLHNPPNLLGIKACRETLPKINQVAVFDTSFHSTIPSHRYRYAIPDKYYEIYKIRKYGFHGTSFKYVTKKAQEILGKDSKMIICHLGNGSSICAIENGKSIDTSMGFTPLQGIIMGTRCGDIDPSIIVEIEKREKISGENVIKILNKESGLKALCGDSDMRLIRERILSNDKKAEIAFKELSESVTKYLAYYTALLNGTDAIVFTGGIGENAYYLRADILKHFEHMGLKIDSKKNEKNEQEISAKGSKVKVLVIPTNEELMIAQDTEKICKTIKNKEH